MQATLGGKSRALEEAMRRRGVINYPYDGGMLIA